MAVEPLFAMLVGDARFDDALPDQAEDGRAERHRVHAGLLAAAGGIDAARLVAEERRALALATALARRDLGRLEHGMDRLWAVGHMPIGFRFGPGLEELAFKQAHRWARRADRHATWALWASGVGMLLAVIAVVTSDASGQPAIAGPVIRASLAADWAGAMTARLASIPAARSWTSRPWRVGVEQSFTPVERPRVDSPAGTARRHEQRDR